MESETYERISQVGEGTYGYHSAADICLIISKVYKALHKPAGKLVALKRIKLEMEKEGFPLTAMREIRLLQRVGHPNVLNLQDIISAKGCVYMVCDYLEYDLAGILSYPNHEYNASHVKCLMKQMLMGLQYLHSRGIIHRDIKGSNILINSQGVLKLADFGLARIYSSNKKDYTNRVITLWYRPPELLLGSTNYGSEVDIWGIGCLLLELFTRKPIFPGTDEISQLTLIYKMLGTPSEESFPGVETLLWYNMLRPTKKYPNIVHDRFQNILTEDCLQLALQMLEMDPTKRISAKMALRHGYFTAKPTPSLPADLPKPEGDWHEFESKQRRASKQASSQSQPQSSSKRVKV